MAPQRVGSALTDLIFPCCWRDVALPCHVEATPPIQYFWSSGTDVSITEGSGMDGGVWRKHTLLKNGTLIIHEAKVQDEGVYVCMAVNSLGQANVTVNLSSDAGMCVYGRVRATNIS